MLLPLNLKTSKSIALSITKTGQSYSVIPCTIINGFGVDEDDENSFSLIPIFDFDEKFNTRGEDLLVCLEEVLAKLKDELS
jgi:hypothetical protein